ncbi:MAG: glycerol-3-phosphate dehydrogenase, partial [Aquincola sp.]|nr:glycerol-3-phosphate dehydrogenase [Aquincola sp.]
MRIAVLGAGAWGTALAAQAALRHRVLLWGRDAAQLAEVAASRRNQRYLPGIELPASLGFEADLGRCLAAVGDEGLVVIATPMASLRSMLQ